ncbi:unnamed protein product [Rotaria magnacalcarata]
MSTSSNSVSGPDLLNHIFNKVYPKAQKLNAFSNGDKIEEIPTTELSSTKLGTYSSTNQQMINDNNNNFNDESCWKKFKQRKGSPV